MKSKEDLATEYQRTHSKETILELWQQVEPLCEKLSRPYIRERGVEAEDAKQESFIACVRAAENFSAEKSLRFTTCLTNYHKWEFAKWLALNRAVSIPSNALTISTKYLQYATTYRETFGAAPADREAAHHLNVPVSAIRTTKKALKASLEPIHPDGLTDQSGEQYDGWDLMPPNKFQGFEDVEREVDRENLRAITSDALKRLSEPQREEIKRRFWNGQEYKDRKNATAAMVKLRKDPKYKRQAAAYYHEYFTLYRNTFGFWKSSGYSGPEYEAIKAVEGIYSTS